MRRDRRRAEIERGRASDEEKWRAGNQRESGSAGRQPTGGLQYRTDTHTHSGCETQVHENFKRLCLCNDLLNLAGMNL